jgi:hypothetical protein
VVSEQGFDWIFFAIVGIPFVLALFDTLKNDGKRPGAMERHREALSSYCF